MAASALVGLGREDASETTLTVDFEQTGSATGPVFPDLLYDATELTLQQPVSLEAGHYRLTFKSRNDLPLGDYTGTFRFRLCQEAACANVYPNTTHTLPYRVTVVLRDWATFQRDATHSGYVRLTVDAQEIKPVWGVFSDDIEGFARVAADAYRVYLPAYGAFGIERHAGVFGLDLLTGEPKWSVGFGETAYVGDAAVANHKVFVPSMVSSSETNPIRALRVEDGSVAHTSTFASQWSSFLAPTLIDGDMYTSSGYYGNVVYRHRQSDGALVWTASGSGGLANKIQAPAADAQHVYYYNEGGLDVFRRSDGARLVTIADPHFSHRGYDYRAAPVLLRDGSVLAYSGTVAATHTMDLHHQIQRPLVRFRPAAGDIAWLTAESYINIPAVRGDLVFAARNGPSRLDAISIDDGSIAWSWTPPDGTQFRSNIVVTDNVLFVSTSENVYAVKLDDRSVVWSYDEPGDLAIAPHNLLLVSELTTYTNTDITGAMRSAVRLIAFRLTKEPDSGLLSASAVKTKAAKPPLQLRRLEAPPPKS